MALKRNDFGKFSGQFRIKHDLLLRDVAQALEVSASFLSNVEHGRRAVPDHWFGTLIEKFNMSVQERCDLRIAVMRSNRTLSLADYDEEQIQVLVAFDQHRDSIDREKAGRIKCAISSNVGEKHEANFDKQ